MRLLFIRHGDPDYDNDTLTETGRREAQALAAYMPSLHPGTCFVSPLGRAQETAAIALENVRDDAGRPVVPGTLDWLQEFPSRIHIRTGCGEKQDTSDLLRAYHFSQNTDGSYNPRIPWDMYPEYYFDHPEYQDAEDFRTSLVAQASDLNEVYDHVTASMDALLASYGYVREGRHYRVEKEYRGTLTFFCHFAITSAFLSHFWNVSPLVPMQSLCMAPTSITELFTEERQRGIAHFRTVRAGDITHLSMAGIEPTNRALFTDVYSDMEKRHW